MVPLPAQVILGFVGGWVAKFTLPLGLICKENIEDVSGEVQEPVMATQKLYPL